MNVAVTSTVPGHYDMEIGMDCIGKQLVKMSEWLRSVTRMYLRSDGITWVRPRRFESCS